MSGDGKKEDLWASILADVSSSTTSRHLQTKNVLILGDEGSGKSNLVARLQGRKYNAEEHPLGTGLEYTYLDVREEDSEDILGRLGVYTLDGNEEHQNLLQFVLTKDTIKDVLVVINLDLARPWLMMESLKRWTKVLADHLDTLGAGAELEELRAKLVRHFQTYSEGGVAASSASESAEKGDNNSGDKEEGGEEGKEGGDEATGPKAGSSSSEAKEEETLLPLEEGVLSVNLGVPILILVTKSDAYTMLQKDRDYRNEHFDFVQLHLRKFALKYGAALAYTGKDAKNKDVLYRYILHRVYGFPFASKATIAGIDTVFIPTGWDNSTHISVLNDGLKTIQPDDAFEAHIKPPIKPKETGNEAVEVKDEQAFLKEQQALLGKSSSSADGGVRLPVVRPTNETAAAASAPAVGAAPRARPASMLAPSGAAPTAAPAGAAPAGAAGGDGKNTDVLANFFTSLLQKKPAGTTGKERKDAAAELEKRS